MSCYFVVCAAVHSSVCNKNSCYGRHLKGDAANAG